MNVIWSNEIWKWNIYINKWRHIFVLFTKLGTRRIDKKWVLMMDDPQYNHIKYVPICTQIQVQWSIYLFQTYVPFRKHGANLYAHVNRLITLFIINILRTLCLTNIKLSTMTSFKFITAILLYVIAMILDDMLAYNAIRTLIHLVQSKL